MVWGCPCWILFEETSISACLVVLMSRTRVRVHVTIDSIDVRISVRTFYTNYIRIYMNHTNTGCSRWFQVMSRAALCHDRSEGIKHVANRFQTRRHIHLWSLKPCFGSDDSADWNHMQPHFHRLRSRNWHVHPMNGFLILALCNPYDTCDVDLLKPSKIIFTSPGLPRDFHPWWSHRFLGSFLVGHWCLHPAPYIPSVLRLYGLRTILSANVRLKILLTIMIVSLVLSSFTDC